MQRLLLLAIAGLALFTAVPAVATDEVPAPPGEAAVRMAEYKRLHDKIGALAQKNAWQGVERAFEDMQATGVMLEFEDYLWGAHAARAIGNIGASRQRLKRCNSIREDREVIDWLAEIDANYGMVTLMGDPGKVELVAEQTPFDPVKKRAMEYAQAQILETGTFEGYLPSGNYTFGKFTVRVSPSIFGETIDVRSDDHIRRLEREAAKRSRGR